MSDTDPSREQLLKAIGLKEVMTEKNFIEPFKKHHFHRYTSREYLQSPEREMDEVYRMSEVTLLHKATGLRAEYLTTESYDGNELRYRCRDVFVITNAGKRVGVTSINVTGQVFETVAGEITFTEVSKFII